MAEKVDRNVKVKWITARVEYTRDDEEMERVFFEATNKKKYYVDLDVDNRSTELIAVTLIRDAYLHGKKLNVWYESRNNRNWIKAVNLWG